MNPKKFRGYCNAGCGNAIKIGATKFCSFRCQQEFAFRLRSAVLESGEYFALQTTSFLRKYLIRRLGERCSRCGWSERHPKTKKVPIEVEHIDGDWRNNRIENLTLLCPNCHSLTPTFRGLNRGRGRAHRLGGRGNPLNTIATPMAPVLRRPQKEFKLPLTQLPLLNADVAEFGSSHLTCNQAPIKRDRRFESGRRLNNFLENQ